MKKIILLICIAAIAGFYSGCKQDETAAPENSPVQNTVQDLPEQNEKEEFKSDAVIHYFESPICPACRQADSFFNSPEGRSRIANAEIKRYELLNSRGEMGPDNRSNLKLLIGKLEAIADKKGTASIVYRDGVMHEFYQRNGIPYHKSDDRYSRRDEPLPIPVFIVNDKVFAGFSQQVVNQLSREVRE